MSWLYWLVMLWPLPVFLLMRYWLRIDYLEQMFFGLDAREMRNYRFLRDELISHQAGLERIRKAHEDVQVRPGDRISLEWHEEPTGLIQLHPHVKIIPKGADEDVGTEDSSVDPQRSDELGEQKVQQGEHSEDVLGPAG